MVNEHTACDHDSCSPAGHVCWGADVPHCAHSHTLHVENLGVHYRQITALDFVSFQASCGTTLALMGANGAGKSSLLRAIAGIISYTGKVSWNNAPLEQSRNEVAYLQQRSMIDWSFPLSVYEVVNQGRYPYMGCWRKPSKHDMEIVQKSLDSMRLCDLQDRQIGELSGGQQQRVFLARALAQEAHILLLDEPFSGLDAATSDHLAVLLQVIAQEGRLVISSHHDLNTAQSIFEKTIVLHEQHIFAYGCTEDVLTPQTIDLCFHGTGKGVTK